MIRTVLPGPLSAETHAMAMAVAVSVATTEGVSVAPAASVKLTPNSVTTGFFHSSLFSAGFLVASVFVIFRHSISL